jgi:hypothetical protein
MALMTSPTPPRRRWFRFGLGTMFLALGALAVMLLVGAFVAYHVDWIRQRHALLEETQRRFANRYAPAKDLDFPAWIKCEACDPPGLLWLFGEKGAWSLNLRAAFDYDADARECNRIIESELSRAKRLFPEAHVVVGRHYLFPGEHN